jgi:hypothetical protein
MTTRTSGPALSNDFDFMVGRWRVHNRFLSGRLCGSHLWFEFEATYELGLLLGGLGNIDQFHSERDGRKIEGMTLRLFDPATGDWTLYWADNLRPGKTYPPMIGRFHGDIGEFFGEEEVDGRKVRCRFHWYRDHDRPRWEQAFSEDGKNWETNWVMTFTRTGAEG